MAILAATCSELVFVIGKNGMNDAIFGGNPVILPKKHSPPVNILSRR